MKRRYFDHAATTPVDPGVLQAMLPWLGEAYGNPSSLHEEGRNAMSAVEDARAKVAGLLNAEPREIIFTGGGTESDNYALTGTAWASEKKGNHIITTAVEHHAVLETARLLGTRGCEITVLPVDGDGLVDPDEVRRAITPKTVLVSVMHANNEVGTIQPIAEIGRITREAGVIFHTDAVQTFGHVPVDVRALNVDLLSLSGHKLYGPKGIGALFVRRGTRIAGFMRGGGQESGRRPGTHNVPGIVGLAEAARLAAVLMDGEAARAAALRDRLARGILEGISGVRLNGHPTRRLPNNLSVCISGAEGEAMLLHLDMEGFAVSSGSACTSGSLDPSHVLLAMGVPAEIAHGSLRMTLGRGTEDEDIDRFLEVLPPVVDRLRKMSPLKNPPEVLIRG